MQKTTTTFATAATLLILLSGCSTGGDASNTPTGPNGNILPVTSPSPTLPTTSPSPTPPGGPTSPVVSIDAAPLIFADGTPGGFLFPGAVVSDADSPNLAGGLLTVELVGHRTGQSQPFELSAPAGPDIGAATLSNDATRLTVTLNAAATPSAIQAFLRGVTLARPGSSFQYGLHSVRVILSESDPTLRGTAARYVNVQGTGALQLTTSGALTLQQAINQIGATAQAQGSVIFLTAGTHGQVSIPTSTNLIGLAIVGPNLGQPTGVTPGGSENSPAVISRADVNAAAVQFDGVTFSEGVSGFALVAGTEARGLQVRNSRFLRTLPPTGSTGIFAESPLRVQDSLFTGWGTGLSAVTVIVERSAFASNEVGAQLAGVSSEVTGNGFKNHSVAHLTLVSPRQTVLSGNDFDGSANVEVTRSPFDFGTVELDARNNWWNSTSGPATPPGRPRVNTTGAAPFTILTAPFLTSDPLPAF
jgi:hypothetical protein